MNYQVFKITESIHGYYYYVVSHIDDEELNLSIAENWAATAPDVPTNHFMSVCCGWDNVSIDKTTISPIDAINKTFPADAKNMLISDEYKKILEEELQKLSQKKSRSKKTPVEKSEAKKEPKPRAKKSAPSKVKIETPSEPLSFN